MRMRPLGDSGLLVSELCLGAAGLGAGEALYQPAGRKGFGAPAGPPNPIDRMAQDAADALVRTALAAGVTIIDTADIYGGRSERMLGRSLRNLAVRRQDLVIATKLSAPLGAAGGTGGVHAQARRLCEESLARLDLAHIDLYQIHEFDPATPVAQSLDALGELAARGLVGHIGLSNWASWQVMKAVGMARARRLAPIASLQAYYTLAGRDLEREIVPTLRSSRLGLMVWSPLACGGLPARHDAAAVKALRRVAADKGRSAAQVALAWLLHQEAVSSVIVGAASAGELEAMLRAPSLRLDAADLALIEEAGSNPRARPARMARPEPALA